MRTYGFNKKKMVVSVIYFVAILAVMLYDLFIVDDATDADFPKMMILCGILGCTLLYNEFRWLMKYRKIGGDFWEFFLRRLPIFVKDEPSLNVYCFNVYVCVIMSAIIPVVMIMKTRL